MDAGLLAEFNGNVEDYLEQLSYTGAAYFKYSLSVGTLIEELVFEKCEYMYALSWNEMVFSRQEKNFDWTNPGFTLVSPTLKIGEDTNLAYLQRLALKKIKSRWKSANSTSCLDLGRNSVFIYIYFTCQRPSRSQS